MRIVLAAVHLEEGPEAVPLGAACVGSSLKAVFPALDLALAETFVDEGASALVEKIAVLEPAAVGFSLYSWNREIIIEAARQLTPEIFLFCGGPEAGALPEGLRKSQGGPFDEVIAGEGEDAAVRVIGRRFFPGVSTLSFERRTLLSEEEAGDLARFPSPWLDGTLGGRGREGALWELARGCPYSCGYCYEAGGGGGRVRYYPMERLREELRLFIREHVPYIFVLDPTFNIDNKRALVVLDMIQEETAGDTHWHFEIRGELVTKDQARRFAALNASLQIGLQTAEAEAAVLAGRDFDRRRFVSGIGFLNQAGAVFGLDLIYGLPGDSLAGYRRSLDFALSLYPNSLDMFRLAVLPGTAFFKRAAEYGLSADERPPYLVRSTKSFPAADLEKAEVLSAAADLFYNKGRAVAWFNQILRPLKAKPSVFLEGFARFAKKPQSIETLQLEYLEDRFRQAKKEALLPAARDLVRFHSAWGRALAEGKTGTVDFTYEPDEVLGEGALDLERFVRSVKPRPARVSVRPGKGGPEMARG
jgi:radical SAM superfamily enzyme YgiQ (UPF0313 family)